MTELVNELRRAGVSEVDDSNLAKALYTTDASLYRVVPSAVACPRYVDELVAAFEVCRKLGVPFTTRGAGTSIAGNSIGTGLIVDTSRYLNKIIDVDVEGESAVVQPGVVQSQLQAAVVKHGLRFGPDPSTSNRCTIGGMIGNNSCGSRTLEYGRTSDNVLALEVVAGTGERFYVGRPNENKDLIASSPMLQQLQTLIGANEDLIAKTFGTFGRQVSGYALEQLAASSEFDIARFLVGSEGTLATTLGAKVRLVRDPAFRGLVVLGYPSMPDAADAVMTVLQHKPTACEGLDARIVDAVRALHGPDRVPVLPEGLGWLFVEVVGESLAEVESKAINVAKDADTKASRVVLDPVEIAHLWRIREDGAGLSSRSPSGAPAYAGWEDAAVPPSSLGPYLREFDALMSAHGITGMPYGHFGDGCMHVRLDFPLQAENGPQRMRAFLVDAAQLVVKYGGSLSGEHGDGRARGELLSYMYSPEVLHLFEQVKALWDPQAILNPGVIVKPRPVDVDLRAPSAKRVVEGLAFKYQHDDGDFSKAVHRCTGVGKCRADITASGGAMCPSYMATKNEKDSTRGRARVLEEMVNGTLVKDGWKSKEVGDALELCLSCKACSTDCPTGVDMATYKAEWLHQKFKGRIRPVSHYALGWLPKWAAIAARAPRFANALLSFKPFAFVGKVFAGVDSRRSLPTFAPQTFRQQFANRTVEAEGVDRPIVALFVDTFTNYFSPDVGMAAVEVLEDAGYRVELTKEGLCCGLTWISTGQLDKARSLLQSVSEDLSAYADQQIPVVTLEPSCGAVLRSDVDELVGTEAAKKVVGGSRTLAEFLTSVDGWTPPDLSGVEVVAQPHCHHHAVMGWQTDEKLLKSANAEVRRLGGCCGLAGNFGVEKGHYEVSVAVAENNLLPAVREATPDTPILADGFSCRTQLQDLVQRDSLHLAQLLAGRGHDSHADR